jgi:hypothetical protein
VEAAMSLAATAPRTARRQVGDQLETVEASALRAGDQIDVGSGEEFAADGVVTEGAGQSAWRSSPVRQTRWPCAPGSGSSPGRSCSMVPSRCAWRRSAARPCSAAWRHSSNRRPTVACVPPPPTASLRGSPPQRWWWPSSPVPDGGSPAARTWP